MLQFFCQVVYGTWNSGGESDPRVKVLAFDAVNNEIGGKLFQCPAQLNSLVEPECMRRATKHRRW